MVKALNQENNKPSVIKEFTLLKQAVIGLSDGLIFPFAICAGLTVISSNNQMIFKWGAVVLLAGAILMGISGYFAAKINQERLALKSPDEELAGKNEELQKTQSLFLKLGLTKKIQDQVAGEIEKDSQEWKAYVEKHSQEFEIKKPAQLPITALIISISFILGGLIPLLPYLFFTDTQQAFYIAVSISLPALFLFGFLKSKVNNEPLVWGAFRLLLLGGAAALAAFAIAKIFVP